MPESRLRARAKGRVTKSDRAPVNQRLTNAEETALCRYIDVLEEAGLYARQHDIQRVANSILWRRDETELPVSPAWAIRFQKRHPEYFIRSQRTLDIERKEAHNRKDIEVFFERWEAILKKYSILLTDPYNFDETGFRIRMGRHQKIVTRDPKAKVYIESSTNRDYSGVAKVFTPRPTPPSPHRLLVSKIFQYNTRTPIPLLRRLPTLYPLFYHMKCLGVGN